jgi:hypothetical protein
MVNITQDIYGSLGNTLACDIYVRADTGGVAGHILNATIWEDNGSGYPKTIGAGGYPIVQNLSLGDQFTPSVDLNSTHTFHPTGTIIAGKYHIVLVDNNMSGPNRLLVREIAGGTYGTPANLEGMTFTSTAGVTWTDYRTNDMVFACYKLVNHAEFNNPTVNNSAPNVGEKVNISINISDNDIIDNYIFSYFNDTYWINDTAITFGQTAILDQKTANNSPDTNPFGKTGTFFTSAFSLNLTQSIISTDDIIIQIKFIQSGGDYSGNATGHNLSFTLTSSVACPSGGGYCPDETSILATTSTLYNDTGTTSYQNITFTGVTQAAGNILQIIYEDMDTSAGNRVAMERDGDGSGTDSGYGFTYKDASSSWAWVGGYQIRKHTFVAYIADKSLPIYIVASINKVMPNQILYNYSWYATNVYDIITQSDYYSLNINTPTIFSNPTVNNSLPNIGIDVNISIDIADLNEISSYKFEYYNGSQWFNDTFLINNLSSIATSVIKIMPQFILYNYTWFAIDTHNTETQSDYYSFLINNPTIFTNNAVNNSLPNVLEDVSFDITINNNNGVNAYRFNYYNGSEWLNDTIIYANNATSVLVSTIKNMPFLSTYNYSWYGQNSLGIWTQSQQFYLNVTVFEPHINMVNLTSFTIYSNDIDDINCTFIVNDVNPNAILNATVTWYKNDIAIYIYDYSFLNATHNVIYTTDINKGEVTENLIASDIWKCSIILNDEYFIVKSNSSSTTILDATPTVINNVQPSTGQTVSAISTSITWNENSSIGYPNTSYNTTIRLKNNSNQIILTTLNNGTINYIWDTSLYGAGVYNLTFTSCNIYGCGDEVEVNNILINSIPIVNASMLPTMLYNNDTLKGYGQLLYDANGHNQNYTYKWYKNSIEYTNGTINLDTSSTSSFNFNNISASELTVYDNWIFSVRSWDGYDYSTWVNSTNNSVLNRVLRDLTLYYPPNNTLTNVNLNPIFSVVDEDEGISCDLNINNGNSFSFNDIHSGQNFTATGATFDFTFTQGINITSGGIGEIKLLADATHNFEICLQNSTGQDIEASCRTYTNNEITNGTLLAINTLNASYLMPGQQYRLRINWNKIQYINMNNSALNSYNDSGDTQTSTVYSDCYNVTGADGSGACGTFRGFQVWSRPSVADCKVTDTGTWNSYNGCVYVTPGDYSCGGAKANPTGSGTFYQKVRDSCRIYDGYTRIGGSDASGTCYDIQSYYTSSCFGEPGYDGFMTSCTPGTKSSCPSSLFSYITNNDYSSYFTYSAGDGTSNINFNDKIVSSGIVSWTSQAGDFLTEDGNYYWNISCTSEGDIIPLFSENRLFIYDTSPPTIYNGSYTTDEDLTFYPEIGDTFHMNVSVYDVSNVKTCNLMLNDTGIWENKTSYYVNALNSTVQMSYIIQSISQADKNHISWNIWCNDTTNNAAIGIEQPFVVKDVTLPLILLQNGTNFANHSVISNRFNNATYYMYLFDDNLFQALVNVTCDISGNIYYWEELDFNVTEYYKNDTINLNGLPLQKCSFFVSSSDDHTNEKIDNYKNKKHSSGLTYNTAEGLTIDISTSDGSKLKDVTSKKTDNTKYTFIFKFKDKATTRAFNITSSGILYPQSGDDYMAHFVAWNDTNKLGNWIDANIKGLNLQKENYVIEKINDKKYMIKITTIDATDTYEFESLGGTNVENYSIDFYIGSAINLTALNIYDNTPFRNFSVDISTANSYPGLENTTLNIDNQLWLQNISNGTYRFAFRKSGWFNQTYILNITNSTEDVLYQTFQSIVNIVFTNVKTGDVLPDVETKLTNINTSFETIAYTNVNGMATLYINASNYNINANKSTYVNFTGNFNIDNEENLTLYYDIGYYAAFNFIDERTLLPFNMAGADSVTFLLFCVDRTDQWTINTTTQLVPISCNYIKYKFVLVYGTQSYYRTYIIEPSGEDFNRTIYLIDLTNTQSIFNNLRIDDLLNNYQNPSIYVKKIIQNSTQIITSDYKDVEGKLGAYLIQNHEYIIEVHSDNNPVRVIGKYSADTAGEKVLSLYDIGVTPGSYSTWSNDVVLTTGMRNISGSMYAIAYYNDTANQTASVTWTLYPNNYGETPIYTATVYDTQNIEFMFNASNYLNEPIISVLDVEYRTGSLHQFGKVIWSITQIPLEILEELGISPAFIDWFITLLLGSLALMATIRTANAMGLMLIGGATLFVLFKWYSLSWAILILAAVVALISFLKSEDKRTG